MSQKLYKNSLINILEEFRREFESLFVALGKRIRNEEDVLYDEYEFMNQ
ncbi:MAG: hypothetical protein ACE5KZ_00855 [Candidatus Scalinduaceae bacterium]